MHKTGQFSNDELRSVSGHSTEKQLLEYIKVKKEEVARELAKKEHFKNPHLKAV